MSESTELTVFSEQDFYAIEAAVLETEKGRWFLNEFARRNRVADTQTLLSAIDRLERNITAQSSIQISDTAELAALAQAIDDTCAEIRSVRNDMLSDQTEIPSDKAVFSELSETARKIAVDLINAAEAFQSTATGLRETIDDSIKMKAIDDHVHKLFSGGWRQDVLAQRIAKAMGLLEHLDLQIRTISGIERRSDHAVWQKEPGAISIPAALTAENLKYFSGDDDLFAADTSAARPKKEPALEIVGERTPATSGPVIEAQPQSGGDEAEPQPAGHDFMPAAPDVPAPTAAREPAPETSVTPDQVTASPETPPAADGVDAAGPIEDESENLPQDNGYPSDMEPSVPDGVETASMSPSAPPQQADDTQAETAVGGQDAEQALAASFEEPAAQSLETEPVTPAEAAPAPQQPEAAETPVDDQQPSGVEANDKDQHVAPADCAETATTETTEPAVTPNVVIIQRGKSSVEPEQQDIQDQPHSDPQAEQAVEQVPPAAQEPSTIEPSQTPDATTDPIEVPPPNEAESSASTQQPASSLAVDATHSAASVDPATDSFHSDTGLLEAASALDLVQQSSGEDSNDDEDDEEKQRIVVIKRTSSAEAEIPFADYLGVDAATPPDPTAD